jgi:hypothetical protein
MASLRRREGRGTDADINRVFVGREPLRNLVSVPMLTSKAGLSPHGAPSRDHDFELVTPDVRAPLDSWSFRFSASLSAMISSVGLGDSVFVPSPACGRGSEQSRSITILEATIRGRVLTALQLQPVLMSA